MGGEAAFVRLGFRFVVGVPLVTQEMDVAAVVPGGMAAAFLIWGAGIGLGVG